MYCPYELRDRKISAVIYGSDIGYGSQRRVSNAGRPTRFPFKIEKLDSNETTYRFTARSIPVAYNLEEFRRKFKAIRGRGQ